MNKIAFFQGFLRSPLEVGSIIPSSRFMVQKVVAAVMEEKPKTIVELGAGTGVLTRELHHQCGTHTSFIAFEKDERLREQLQSEFSNRPIYADALTLSATLNELKVDKVDCIVSGLPFFLFPDSKRKALLSQVHRKLKNNGCLIMYQYTTKMRPTLESWFDEVTAQYVFLNIPPAFVYTCRKKG